MSRSARAAAAVLAALLALPLALWGGFATTGSTPSGLRVDGEVLAPTDDPRAVLERRAARWLARDVRMDADGIVRERTREELGLAVDVAAVAARAARLGRTGNPLRDLPDLLGAWSGRVDLPWPVTVDEAATRAFVDELANEVDRPPRPAQLDGRGGLAELSADGARLDRDAAVHAIATRLREGRRAVTLPVETLPSGVGEAALPPVLHPDARPVVVGRYSTRFGTRGAERDRAHNVATAARALDGAVIPPLGRLSFNDAVGPRGRAEGYRLAHVILDGEMVDGLGGGVCQVASTLHAAAFLAGLEMVEHVPHSRPSSYIPMGLDATVVWPRVDLVIRNPYRFPITVRSRARDGQMVVELFGREQVRRVEWRRRTLSTEPWTDRYVEDETVPPGEERVTQQGIRGFTILRERTIEDGRGVHLEERRIRYPPTDRVIRVAPGGVEDALTVPPNPYAAAG